KQKELQELLSERLRAFLSDSDAVYPLQKGQMLQELQSASKTSDSRDIRKMIDDVFEMVANSFHLPIGLGKGDTVGLNEQMNAFLMFCINPICEMVSDEFNRKLYKEELVLERTYMKIDTTRIKVSDLKDIAGSLELLFRTGTNTIDDNLAALGRERTGLPENNERHISKNYAKQGSEEETLKGGGNVEE
ncbi:phage portal protein, partial [Listeria fleischmannii]